ncbi:MAG: ABC transporter ATP-binding protein [Limnothrix sp.]|uniref:ABC transporter ATP-binding protein n=1 Tax=unclassified Limnothrix TaxID=2632864 RepID=UPI00081DA3C9|nr:MULTISPECIES: ABC transporter ATP-binding protein [unclassified Limnothrix]MEB3118424.1 ABC transporter ATP-binding protein [Limnothrix sp.]OCQ94937.1 lysozyme [Limnothrix sp. P13C2]MBD2159473.1 ABC transporter ATP-binding protein [Limnothrix sp. FACHB-1083]MBD2190175.1 ABC transporter ATP-binding protein [Limnothrix sp. FACHB-1088]MBD2551986.1 ABC transporter ATP-binding protein [Limnothrix sp. FACHB-708]
MTPAIAIRNLQKRYGDVTAVDHVSLEVKPGEIFGLLGPNGAGKTTTIRCLCTLAQPDGGEIFVSGVSVLREPRSARKRLGYVAQDAALDKVLTGREMLELHGALYHLRREAIGQRIAAMADLLGLGDWLDRKTGTYSGGIRKRLDLATGLLHEPDVLVLDEPTAGLDIESRMAVWEFLRKLPQWGTTVLITSHYLEEIDALADRVAILDQGQVIALGTPSELKARLGGDRISLRIREFTPAAEAETAQTLLTALPCVKDAMINRSQGNTLNLVVDDLDRGLTLVQQALEQAGLPVFGIAQSRPSLDDVYLAATGRTLLDADLAAGDRDPKLARKQNMR